MTELKWTAVLARAGVPRPVNLDDPVARARMPSQANSTVALRWPKLLRLPDTRGGRIGLRVRRTLPDVAHLAIRLASMTAERGTIPIILSHCGKTNLEDLGFRVEHIAGETEAELADREAEMIAFWNLAIIVDAEEIAGFG